MQSVSLQSEGLLMVYTSAVLCMLVHHWCNVYYQTACLAWQRWQRASSWLHTERCQSTRLWNYTSELSFYCSSFLSSSH